MNSFPTHILRTNIDKLPSPVLRDDGAETIWFTRIEIRIRLPPTFVLSPIGVNLAPCESSFVSLCKEPDRRLIDV